MADTLLKLFLQQLHPAFAIPLTVVLAGLLLSIVGKSKSFFDDALTTENARVGLPYITATVAIAHSVLGLAAAYWFYFYTDLFSPPVNHDLTHPLGRAFVRRADWLLVATEAALYVSLVLALWRFCSGVRNAASVFILAVVPTAATIATVAILWPTLITPNSAPLPLGTPSGLLWWYADVVLAAFPVGVALLAIWLVVSGLQRPS